MNNSQKALIGCGLGHFALDLYAAILIPLYPYLSEKLGINLATISIVIALSHSLCSFLQPVFGYISDKTVKRIFIFLGIIVCSLFFPLAFYSPNPVVLTLLLVLAIAGNASFHPQATLILKQYSSNLSKAMGIFLGLGTIGYSFGPYLSTFVLKNLKENNYIYISLFGLVVCLLVYFITPKITKIKNEKTNFFEAIKEIIKNKVCMFLVLITVIKAALVMSFGTYIPFLLKDYGFSLTNVGLIMTLFFVMGGLSMIISSKIEKYTKLNGLIFLSFTPILPILLLTFYFLNISKFLATISIISIGFFILLQAGAILAHACKIVKASGIISGVIQGFTLAIGSLLLIPFGFLAQNLGVKFVLILISLIAFIFGFLALKFFKVIK